MADKDNKPKTTKPATKPVTKPTATVKPAEKPAAKPVTKPAATVKPAAKPAAKPVTKPTATVKPADMPAAKTAAKPAATKTAVKAEKTPEPKTAAGAVKPETKPAAEAKPAAKVDAPKRASKAASAPSEEKPKKAAATEAKPEKAKKQSKKKSGEKSGGSGKGGNAVAAIFNNKIRVIVMAAVAFVLILALIIGIIFGAKSCNKGSEPPLPSLSKEPPSTSATTNVPDGKPESKDTLVLGPVNSTDPAVADIINDAYKYEYPATSAVGFNGKVLGTVERVKPVAETKDERDAFPLGVDIPEGTVRYPKYGYTMSSVIGSDKDGARAALIEESDWLTAYGTRNNSGNGNNGDGSYNMMDADGYLYFVDGNGRRNATNPDGSHRQLYKHTAAEGMYYGGINAANPELSDDEPRIVKEVTIRPRGYGSYSVTGVYAPAGEVIKIQISEEDMNATGGITIHIGQALYNGQSNNIWVAKGQMQRFPNILNTMTVNKQTATLEDGVYTAYVGSFVGGPLYIRNTSATFTATISGGVRYSHFILGYTSEEEYEENKQSSTPYFDLEVWNYGVLHSGPKLYSQKYSYEDIYKVAVLWEKVASVTTTNSNQGIVFLYDPFVAAGAAVAFPGRSSVNCPAGWMDGSLNYNGIVSSGSWGNFHEYHHNFQNYGVGNGGEVTNNGMTLVSYALFTKISSKRGISAYGGQGLGGWNNYTSATWALNDLLSIQRGGSPSNGNQGLAIYATLLHNFGADNYIQAKVIQQKGGYGQSYAGYFRAWEAQTHNDMRYFFTDVLKGLDNATANKWHNSEYTSTFVPVSCVYQTGRSYMYDGQKKYFKTMQPYLIKSGEPFNIDLSEYSAPSGQYKSGSIIIPKGFVYRVKSVTQPKNGTIKVVDNYNLKYTPAAGAKTGSTSGQIVVTLEIAHNSYTVDDVDLVLEFEISQELNRMTLERTTYTYAEGEAYTDAVAAYNANFAGFTDKQEYDHSNPVQNANTDIWYYPDNEQNRKDHPASPDYHFSSKNKVEVIDGKLYFETDGKYRVYLRGRINCAAYFSLDGQNYKLGAKVTNGSGANFYANDANTYFDVEFHEGNVTVTAYCNGEEPTEYTYTLTPNANKEIINWLYVKEVMIVQSSPLISYIGLGYGSWTQTMFTMEETYHRADGKTEVPASNGNPAVPITPDHEEYAYTLTKYNDYRGNEVARTKQLKDGTVEYYKTDGNNHEVPSDADEVSAMTESRLIAPTGATYVNAYRADYEFPDNTGFEADYYYTRSYNYNYEGETEVLTRKYPQTYMAEISNYRPWADDYDTYGVQNLFDGNPNTAVHTYNSFYLSEEQPAILAFDMGQTVTANSLSMTVYPGGNGGRAFPKILTLEGSLDGENWFEMGKWSNLSSGANSGNALTFPEKQFRYYKITVPKSNYDITERFAISELSLSYTMRLTGNGSNLIAPTNENIVFSKNWTSQVAVSTFGRVNVGHAGDKAVFEFTGTRLAILTSDAYGKNFDVYIDGVKASSIEVVPHSGVYGITYLTDKLASGKHKVEIRCTGEANIDSFAIYNEAN